ncbi:hypothetical protein V1504DRAFT_464370, partial [Lipomyces starkeyi]
YEHIEDLETEIALMKESMVETVELNLLLNHIAPFVYRGHKWAGQLSTAFIEVWRPDSILIRYVSIIIRLIAWTVIFSHSLQI